MTDLELTLTWLGMDRYLERLIEAGFDSWETVLEIQESDLDALDVALGHRRKLQKEIAKSKRLAWEEASSIPSYPTYLPPPTTSGAVSSSLYDVQQGATPAKRAYRHHPKPDPNAPERPYSAYVLFTNHTREQLREQNLSFADSSKVVGDRWQQLTNDEKEEWKKKGAEPWERYKAELAEYHKTNDFREYQRYLADFKAAQIAKNPQVARNTTMSNPMASSSPSTSHSSKQRPMAVSPTGLSGSEEKSSEIAIKRLKRYEEAWNLDSGSGTRSVRVKQACESCRNRKIKCHGEKPTCRSCKQLRLGCFYATAKRDEGRHLDDGIRQKLKAYEELLLKFAPQVDEKDRRSIQEAMLMPLQVEATGGAFNKINQSEKESSSRGDEDDSDASGHGSMGVTDRIDQDESSTQVPTQQTPDFLGQSSQSRWVERLNRELVPKQDAKKSEFRSRNRSRPRKSEPYPEDMETAAIGHQIDPFSLPVKSTANSLVTTYFSTIHISFPILDKIDFMEQYDQLYSTMDPEGFEHSIFVAELQAVFAIAAVHAHLIQADWTGDARDHMLYFAQARVLAVDTGVFNDDSSIGQIQVFGLGGMYLLLTNQLNRAWNISSLAVRSAQALGLHLRDVSGSVTAKAKDIHAYTWFSLLTLESMLVLMTGRPTMINSRDCTVAIPRPITEGKPSSTINSRSETPHKRPAKHSRRRASKPGTSEVKAGSSLNRTMNYDNTRTAAVYFVHYAELCMLAMEVVGELYQPGIKTKGQADIQRIIDEFDNRLFEWKDSVNPPFDAASPSSDPETESCRVALRILFYNTRTIINRPCLCRFEDRPEGQSRSRLKRLSSANKCVDSARATLNIIINKPYSSTLRKGTLWWMLTNHLKRALTVLLLELAFRAEHMPSDAGEILAEAKAAVNWLYELGNSSPDARRTSSHMYKLLRLAAKKVGGDTSDMTYFEDVAATDHAGQQQLPSAMDHDGADASASPVSNLYGKEDSQELQYYEDWTARNELDQFGFLMAEGGKGSLFPTASDMDEMNVDEEGVDGEL